MEFLSYVHPAPDLDAPAPADAPALIARGFVQVRQAEWVRQADIERVAFNTGPGPDQCWVSLRSGLWLELQGDEARAFWVTWTAYLAGDA